MGGTTDSTTQATATPLQQLFAGSQGYHQMAIPTISAPQAPTLPQSTAMTPAMAAQQTVASMLARTPPAPVVAAPAGSAGFTGDNQQRAKNGVAARDWSR